MDFLNMLEQVAKMGVWSDEHMICMSKCKMTGFAREFIWNDEKARAAKTFEELKAVLIERFDTEPYSVRIQKFMGASQRAGEDVRAFATRVQILGRATLDHGSSVLNDTTGVVNQLLKEQMRSQFVNGLREPVRRFVLSRSPKDFNEAVDVAAQEEANETLSSGVARIHIVGGADDKNQEIVELKERLATLEKLLIAKEQSSQPTFRPSRRPNFRRCYLCSEIGHIVRNCPRNTVVPQSTSTIPKNA